MTALGLADALAKTAFAGRNPNWTEYRVAAPCDQRAIVARWREIAEQALQGTIAANIGYTVCLQLFWAGQPFPQSWEIEKLDRARIAKLRRESGPTIDINAIGDDYDAQCNTAHEKITNDNRKDAREDREDQFLGGGLPV